MIFPDASEPPEDAVKQAGSCVPPRESGRDQVWGAQEAAFLSTQVILRLGSRPLSRPPVLLPTPSPRPPAAHCTTRRPGAPAPLQAHAKNTRGGSSCQEGLAAQLRPTPARSPGALMLQRTKYAGRKGPSIVQRRHADLSASSPELEWALPHSDTTHSTQCPGSSFICKSVL